MTAPQPESPAPWVDLYVLACRMFENLAGGWRSDAKEQAGELKRWAESYTPKTADEQALVLACQGLHDFDLPWEKRVHALGRCMPTIEQRLVELLEPPPLDDDRIRSGPSAGLTPAQLLKLLIAVNRVFDAVSCTFTGEARGYAADLRALAATLDFGSEPTLAGLFEAIAETGDSGLPWEQRCQRLSRTLCPLEKRLEESVAALVHQRSVEPPVSRRDSAVYHWAREIHPSRIQAVGAVMSTRALLNIIASKPMAPAVHGWHWTLPPKRKPYAPTFLAPFPSGVARIHPHVVTTREWFAKKVMSRALASARRRYPGWEAHRFEPGPRVGEWRLVFANERAGLADQHIEAALQHHADESPPPLHAFWALRRATPGAWQRHDPAVLRALGKRPPDNRVLLLVIDALEPTPEAVREAVMAWRMGVLPRRAPSAHRFGFADIKDRLEWLTWPERVLLNAESTAYAALTEADIALLEAASVLDVDAMEEALHDGANPDSVHPEHGSALSLVITGELDQADAQDWAEPDEPPTARDERRRALELLLEHGAHPDLHTPFHSPALLDAVARRDAGAVRTLLGRGADASIIDIGIGAPTDPIAWDMALDLQDRARPADRKVLRLLLEHRDSPLFTKAEETALRADLRRDPV